MACSETSSQTDDSSSSNQGGSMSETQGGMAGGTLNQGGTNDDPMMEGGMMESNVCTAPANPPCDGQVDPPPPLNEHVAVYDDSHQMMIIFGGNTAVPENCGYPAYTGEGVTWLFYDYDQPTECGAWVKLEDNQPPGRARHSGTLGEGKMWIFGGRVRSGTSGPYSTFNDLWAFDVNTRTWEEITFTGPAPAPRYNTSLTYDPVRRALWVFAGNGASDALGPASLRDLWKFDIETRTWTEINPPSAIISRMWHSATFDSKRDRLVFYGGADNGAFFDDASYFSDLIYYWPGEDRWNQDNPEVSPDGRFWGRMVYMSDQDQYLLFGGHDDQNLGNRNDSWVFDPQTSTWIVADGEDTYNRPPNGFCDFPADFTNVDRSLPERRNAHTLVWSDQCGKALLFGGKTDCGAINDVWRFDTSGWTNLELATAGESCMRWRSNPDNCANMCF
jgi:hypothetical protein